MTPATRQRRAVSAAIGLRVHSGWGALIAVSGRPGAFQISDRRRIEIVDREVPGAVQPYHFAEKLDLRAAEAHIEKCATMAARLALDGMSDAVKHLRGLGCRLAGAVILLSAARPLPPLARILASHPMIHTAEGEFFREAFRHACKSLGIPVTGIRERELEERASAVFGRAASQEKKNIADMGRVLGPPWTQDQKAAALAATILLAD